MGDLELSPSSWVRGDKFCMENILRLELWSWSVWVWVPACLFTSCDYGQVTDCPWAFASSSVKGAKVVTSIVRASYISHLFFSGIIFKAEQERPLPAMKNCGQGRIGRAGGEEPPTPKLGGGCVQGRSEKRRHNQLGQSQCWWEGEIAGRVTDSHCQRPQTLSQGAWTL